MNEMQVLKDNFTKIQQKEIKRIIEALLFSSPSPIPINKIKTIIETYAPIQNEKLRKLIDELAQEYQEMEKAFKLEQISEGYLLRTCPKYDTYIRQLLPKKKEKLSQASLEVLAIIAHKQPITRTEIESIRGVDCSGMIQGLLEKELIKPDGKLEAPGRPTLYGITKKFLIYFGIKDCQELNSLTENFITSS